MSTSSLSRRLTIAASLTAILAGSLAHSTAAQSTRFVEAKSGALSTLAFHPNWRKTWHQIVPIQLGGNYATDLLFYDRVNGDAKFFESTGNGNITLKRHLTGWRKTWDMIIPGHFSGASNSPTDLLFYDAAAGLARFYQVNADATITLLKQYNFQHWDMIIPGNWGGSAHTDLLFYSRTRGEAKFFRTDGAGNISLLKAQTFSKNWDHIVPGSFGGGGGTNLFFYRRVLGEGQFYSVNASTGSMALMRSYTSMRKTWDEIVPGLFDGQFNATDLLFYDRTAGEYRLAFVNGGVMSYQPVRSTPKTYNRIVSGWFGTSWGALLYDHTQYLRVHAVRCANTNGSRQAAIVPSQVKAWVDQANETWAAAGIQFIFDERTDFEDIRDSLLNSLDLCSKFATQAECDAAKARAEAIGAREPCKITMIFRHGNGTVAAGSGFSSPVAKYIAMPGFNATKTNYYYLDTSHPDHGRRKQGIKLLAHEIGHYLKLGGHTHLGIDYRGYLDPHRAVIDYMRTYSKKSRDDMDADKTYARDTPPDLGVSYFTLNGWNPANPHREIRIRSAADGIDFTTNPDTHNVMSYYGFCNEYLRISPEQARNGRDYLYDPVRKQLLDPCNLPGLAEPFGVSCVHGQSHYVIGEPSLRQRTLYILAGAPPQALATFTLGSNKHVWGSVFLPLKLDVIGMTGCWLYTDPLIQIGTRASAVGEALLGVTIPNDPALINTTVYTQFSVATPGANPTGLTTTNAVETRIGG